MRLNVRNLTKGLEYHGEVDGKKQHYYVFSGGAHYFVMSLSPSKPKSGNFNLVSKIAVEKPGRRLKGQQAVTSKAVRAGSRGRSTIPTDLTALNMLYILVAIGQATIDMRYRSKQLFFNVRA